MDVQIKEFEPMTVEADFVPPEGIQKQEIGGGRYAVVVHKGGYDKLGDTYCRLFGQWLPGSGEEPAGPPCEIYLTCPDSTPEEEAVTEIRLPLK
jgi:AraC family transcriptional regulator